MFEIRHAFDFHCCVIIFAMNGLEQYEGITEVQRYKSGKKIGYARCWLFLFKVFGVNLTLLEHLFLRLIFLKV